MWATKKLHEVCDIQSGLWKGKKEPFTNALVLRNTNFTSSGRLDYSNVVELEVETKQLMKREVVKDDIILEKSGGGDKTPVGRVCIHNATSDVPFSLSNFTARLRVKNRELLDAHFLHRFLYFLYISGKTEPMQRHSTGIRNLQLSQYKNIDIPLPPLAEQKRIVERLDKAFGEIDKAIATAEVKKEEVERLKAATLSAMLDRGCQSGESITEDEEDSVMWETVRLGDVCQIVNGSTPLRKEPKYWDNGTVPWFTIDDLRVQGKEISSTIQSVTENAVDEKKVKLVPPDCVLLCCTASIGEAAIARVRMATNQQFNALIPRVNCLYADFLYYVVKTLKDELLGVSGSTTINFISVGKLKDIKIPLPPLAEQKRIVERLDKAFAEIEIVGDKTQSCVENYAALKAAILKKELTPSETV